MHVVLVANYQPDRQESMQRFATMLREELLSFGHSVEILRPANILGRLCPGYKGISKWLGYLDKFLLFPYLLKKRVRLTQAPEKREFVVFHICDHSNSIYRPYLKAVPHLITCHDLLAIRSALNEFPNHQTSSSGKILQKWISFELRKFTNIAFVSKTTALDFQRLFKRNEKTFSVIYNGLNFPYRRLPQSIALPILSNLEKRLDLSLPRQFLFHIGGNQWYKNRMGLVEIYNHLSHLDETAPPLVIAGKENSPKISQFIESSGLKEKIFMLGNVTHDELNALYSSAHALLFPSLAEGFGWPVIEAQASGCCVITSNRAPLTEIGGTSPIYIDPASPVTAASQILDFLAERPETREERIQQGLQNAAKFSVSDMMKEYLCIYEELLRNPAPNGKQ